MSVNGKGSSPGFCTTSAGACGWGSRCSCSIPRFRSGGRRAPVLQPAIDDVHVGDWASLQLSIDRDAPVRAVVQHLARSGMAAWRREVAGLRRRCGSSLTNPARRLFRQPRFSLTLCATGTTCCACRGYSRTSFQQLRHRTTFTDRLLDSACAVRFWYSGQMMRVTMPSRSVT